MRRDESRDHATRVVQFTVQNELRSRSVRLVPHDVGRAVVDARLAVDVGLVPRAMLVRLSRSGRCLHPFSFSFGLP